MRFARVTTLRFVVGSTDDGFALVADSIVPTILRQPGCGAVILLREPSGDATTITLWATEADMAAAAASNFPAQLAKLDGLLREPPWRRTYEIAAVTLAHTGGFLERECQGVTACE